MELTAGSALHACLGTARLPLVTQMSPTSDDTGDGSEDELGGVAVGEEREAELEKGREGLSILVYHTEKAPDIRVAKKTL